MKALLQWVQMKGLSPVCFRMCTLRLSRRVKDEPHNGHMKGFCGSGPVALESLNTLDVSASSPRLSEPTVSEPQDSIFLELIL